MKKTDAFNHKDRYHHLPLQRIMTGSFLTLILVILISMGLSTLSLWKVSNRTQQLYNEDAAIFVSNARTFTFSSTVFNIAVLVFCLIIGIWIAKK